jgi:hypothetical protein
VTSFQGRPRDFNDADGLRVLFGRISHSAGVNFINIVHEAFTRANPESVKILSSHQYLFELLGSGCIKASRKHVSMSLTVRKSFYVYEN